MPIMLKLTMYINKFIEKFNVSTFYKPLYHLIINNRIERDIGLSWRSNCVGSFTIKVTNEVNIINSYSIRKWPHMYDLKVVGAIQRKRGISIQPYALIQINVILSLQKM